MPIYEYTCSQCGKTQDVLQKMSDPAPETCEHCGAAGSLARQVSRTSFVLKGGGWYSDLYGSSKKSGESSSSPSPSSSGASTGGGKTESTSSSSGAAASTAPAATPATGTGKS